MNCILAERMLTWNLCWCFVSGVENGIRGIESVLVSFIVRQRKESSVPYDDRCVIAKDAKDTKDTKAMSDDESTERKRSFASMS